MDSLRQIGELLENANSILIFPHESIDGDALGSSVALSLGLRSLGKTSYVIMDEVIPDNIFFIENGCCSWDMEVVSQPDVCICIDNGEISRINTRQKLFDKGKKTVLIDHHRSSIPFLNLNYIDVKAAASAEIVYELLLLMDIRITPAVAEAIYVGIVTDTGRFQYSNTTKKTHEIVAELMDHDIDQNKISVEIYQSISQEKIKLESSIIETLRIECDGKVAVAYMTNEMLKKSNAKDEDTEGMVEILRNLRGIEVAIFVREKENKGIKVSMRSKYNFDVSQIAKEFNGGGHKKAAGFNSDDDIYTVITNVIDEIKDRMS